MKNFFSYEFPIGEIFIAEESGKITDISFSTLKGSFKETPIIKKAKIQLEEYFKGKRKNFDLPLKLEGTEFQKKVWTALISIPYGETVTYKEIAVKIGNPKAARAVGTANNKNKILIIIPCHRIIGSNGDLKGYRAGLNIKEQLLKLEKA